MRVSGTAMNVLALRFNIDVMHSMTYFAVEHNSPCVSDSPIRELQRPLPELFLKPARDTPRDTIHENMVVFVNDFCIY